PEVVVRPLTVTGKGALGGGPTWTESPAYVAVTCRVPEVDGDDSMSEHVAVAPVPARVHIAVGVKNAFPDGVLAVPTSVSVTVIVQSVVCPTSIVDGVQL